MEGKILDFSIQSNSGAISGEDGERYNFDGADWKEDSPPARGMSVDFSVEGNQAKEIYLALSVSSTGSAKSKRVAALLAICLGGLGLHKFYLGYTVSGTIFLLVSIVGWVVAWFLDIPPILNYLVVVIAGIEAIIYLTRSNEEFEQTYVIGKKELF